MAAQDTPKSYNDNAQAILADYIRKAHKNMTKQSQAMENLIPVGQTKEEADKHRDVLWRIQQENRRARLEKNRKVHVSRKTVVKTTQLQMSRKERRELAEQRRKAAEDSKTPVDSQVIKETPVDPDPKVITENEPTPPVASDPNEEAKVIPETPVVSEPEAAKPEKTEVTQQPTLKDKVKLSMLRKMKRLQAKRSVNKTK